MIIFLSEITTSLCHTTSQATSPIKVSKCQKQVLEISILPKTNIRHEKTILRALKRVFSCVSFIFWRSEDSKFFFEIYWPLTCQDRGFRAAAKRFETKINYIPFTWFTPSSWASLQSLIKLSLLLDWWFLQCMSSYRLANFMFVLEHRHFRHECSIEEKFWSNPATWFCSVIKR